MTMESSGLLLCVILLMFTAPCYSQGHPWSDKTVFDLLYQTSKHYGLVPTVFYLSTYTTYYTDAEIACETLGGYLAEINSPAEFQFIKDFIIDDVSEHEFIHINAYRNSNSGDLVSSRGVDLVAIINDESGGSSSSSSSNSNSNSLYFDYWGNHPTAVQNPPACLEFDKRRSVLRMTTSRCDRSINRYICEKQLLST